MWIVKLALNKPYTFAVLALLILLAGVGSILSMPTDVFPAIDIPVVTVIWSYPGFTPNDMEKRFVTQSERAYTTSVNDIEHIESQSVSGVGVIRIYFQPGANIAQGISQVTATSQTIQRILPPGTQPPYILRYDASDVPVIQAAIHSDTLNEQQLSDYATNFVRTQFATVQGAQVTLPYGGRGRVINVDINPQALYAHGLSPYDVSSAISAQNLVLPTGDAKIGMRDYNVQINGSPSTVDALNDLPIKVVNGSVVYVRDVAQVRDGYSIQQNIVDQNGKRAVLLQINKSGSASTLDVVNRVRAALPRIMSTLPSALKIDLIADQSIFVKASVQGVVREATIAACLTALMILLFLGSLRSTAIVAVSIPLSILASIAVLHALGESLNTTTLGGLALAVGILVDDTTVTIENINRYLGMGHGLRKSIIEGSAEIALPALVSTLSICIVFLPMALLSGVARYLFLPLAEAVIFAMLASYLLSRTVTPTFAMYLLPKEVGLFAEEGHEEQSHSQNGSNGTAKNGSGKNGDGKNGSGKNGNGTHSSGKNGVPINGSHHNGNGYTAAAMETAQAAKSRPTPKRPTEKQKKGVVWRIHSAFNKHFEKMREAYKERLTWVLDHRLAVTIVFVVFCGLSFCLFPFIGRDFFPQVDAGQFRLHVRVPPSTRLEETAKIFSQVEAQIHKTVPQSETALTLDNIGEPIFRQPGLWRQRDCRAVRRRDFGVAEPEASSNRAVCGSIAPGIAEGVPTRDVLLPACRYCEPDSQLWFACAD